MPSEMTLPYAGTEKCQTVLDDMQFCGKPATHKDALAFRCFEHGMLSLIAGLKPTPLPQPDEVMQIILEATLCPAKR